MNRIIQIVTEKLTNLLPDSQQNYKLDDLRSWGFPNFIVNRIQVELERNLAESMQLPQTDWANMQSTQVQDVWQQFIIAIRNEAWLPASYARPVIETAVADVLEMLVEPRKNIPQIIFGANDELTLEQLNQRLKLLVVYRHFAHLLQRYMEKKELDVLTKDRCVQIIKKADEKVTSRYTPLNWAQMLEPLFKLMNEQIDSSLLRLFFEDKKMPRIARKFDFMEKAVNRAVLIETLSSPESLNMEGFEEDQSDLFGSSESDKNIFAAAEERTINEEEQDKAEEQVGSEDDIDVGDNEVKSDDKEEPVGEEDASPGEDDSEEVSDFEDDDIEDKSNTGDDEESPTPLTNKSRESNIEFEHEEASLNTIFTDEDEDEDEDHSDKMDFENENGLEENSGLSGGLNDVFEEDETIMADEEEPSEDEVEADEIQEESLNEAEDNNDEEDLSLEITADQKQETPMWQRFMSTEELDQLAEEEKDSSYDNEFLEEPIFDISMEKEPTEEEIAELKGVLEDKHDYFVQKIFGGSERAFNEALEKIASKKGWRDASRFIEKEIFKRNMIDVYSEEAVDFTDRLHNYFLENPTS